MIRADTAAVVAVARSQVGYREVPVNRTKYGQWFGWDGVAWCAIWVSWCFAAAGFPLPPIQTPKGVAGVALLRSWAQRDGSWRARSSGYVPKRGDLVIFEFSHVGIVIDVLADGRIWTVEGNTNSAGSRTGGMVCEHYRSTRIAGYVVVADAKATRPAVSAVQTTAAAQPAPPVPHMEADMFLIVEGVGHFACVPGLRPIPLTREQLVLAQQRSPGVPTVTLDAGTAQAARNSGL